MFQLNLLAHQNIFIGISVTWIFKNFINLYRKAYISIWWISWWFASLSLKSSIVRTNSCPKFCFVVENHSFVVRSSAFAGILLILSEICHNALFGHEILCSAKPTQDSPESFRLNFIFWGVLNTTEACSVHTRSMFDCTVCKMNNLMSLECQKSASKCRFQCFVPMLENTMCKFDAIFS